MDTTTTRHTANDDETGRPAGWNSRCARGICKKQGRRSWRGREGGCGGGLWKTDESSHRLLECTYTKQKHYEGKHCLRGAEVMLWWWWDGGEFPFWWVGGIGFGYAGGTELAPDRVGFCLLVLCLYSVHPVCCVVMTCHVMLGMYCVRSKGPPYHFCELSSPSRSAQSSSVSSNHPEHDHEPEGEKTLAWTDRLLASGRELTLFWLGGWRIGMGSWGWGRSHAAPSTPFLWIEQWEIAVN